MKHLREELWFNTPNRRDYINITPDVERLVTQSGVEQGLCLVNAMHITKEGEERDRDAGRRKILLTESNEALMNEIAYYQANDTIIPSARRMNKSYDRRKGRFRWP